MNQALIVLQARFASQRLPGKALAHIGGRPMLARCLDRLRAESVAPVVLATTTNPEDDALAALACDAGVPVVRGPVADVLRRFTIAAARFDATYVVRATADNPAVDIGAAGRVLERLVASGAEYVVESGLPYGACVEAVTVDALNRADAIATAAEDREHVTRLIRRDRLFQALEVPAPAWLTAPNLRLTVDTLQDLAFMRRLVDEMGNPAIEPPLRAYIAAARSMAPSMAVAV